MYSKFEYILESIENGQHKQAKELFKELSDNQGMQHLGEKHYFFCWVRDCYSAEKAFELMDYFGKNMCI